MDAEDWVARFAAEIGGSPPGASQVEEILELAAVAAHASERIAAPVACWIAGRAGKPLAELIEAAERAGEA